MTLFQRAQFSCRGNARLGKSGFCRNVPHPVPYGLKLVSSPIHQTLPQTERERRNPASGYKTCLVWSLGTQTPQLSVYHSVVLVQRSRPIPYTPASPSACRKHPRSAQHPPYSTLPSVSTKEESHSHTRYNKEVFRRTLSFCLVMPCTREGRTRSLPGQRLQLCRVRPGRSGPPCGPCDRGSYGWWWTRTPEEGVGE
jgi:hypothetical protein